jgi:fatty-acyl-CoA synthase
MALGDRLHELRREGQSALFRLRTLGRVGKKLGMHRAITWPGARVLVREAARGKTNPSLIFRFHAKNDPDRTVAIQATWPGKAEGGKAPPHRLVSYRELDAAIDRIGVALGKLGVGRGSRVLLLLKNRIEFLSIQPALGRIGGAAVPASWRSTVPEIEYLCAHSGARAIFFDADIAETLREALPRLAIPRENLIAVGGAPEGFTTLEQLIENQYGTPPDSSEDGSMVMYTSGTTGRPKGAVRAFQKDALAAALSFIGETPMALGDVHLTACPLYHSTAVAFSSFTVILGGTVVVMSDFKPQTFLELVQRYRVTTTALVPTMIHRIVELGADVVRRYDLSSLQAIFSGGAPLDGTLAIEAMNLLGDKIWNFYGATETGVVTLASPADLRASPGTIGPSIPGVEVRLVDEQGRICRAGEVGELYAKSPMLVQGYHADEEATKKSMRDGFFSVGDLARQDARGCFHIEGRKRDMIISGGVNVYPAEVEGVLHEHPAVADAAVVGVPDKEWGERVRAFLVLRAGADADAETLKAHCRGRLSGPKVPRDYVFLESLPRNPTGKVLKRDLRAMEVG